MMQRIESQQAECLLGRIQNARRIVITSHARPDGDAVGCTAAMLSFLREVLKKDARAVLPDVPPANLQFLFGPEIAPYIGYGPGAAEAAVQDADLVICLDCSGFSRTEALQPYFEQSEAYKVLIDHHVDPKREAFDLVFSETEISSASELLYHILMALPCTGGDPAALPAGCAAALLAGMTTDTNNFANSVFPTTFGMASALLAAGVDRDRIIDELYHTCPERRIRLMGFALQDRLTLTPEGAAYMILSGEDLGRFGVEDGDTEGFVNIPLTIGKVRLSILLKQDGAIFRVSIRSRKSISARLLAKQYFHGGGHEQAAGGKVLIPQDIPSAGDIKPHIERILKEYLA